MARQKKYTAATLGKACERYFAAITRRVKVTEMVDSGKRDDKGHVILIPVPVKNTLGEEVEVTEYIIPPSMHELCAFLRIDRATWSRYMGKSEEFAAVGERVRERMKAWNEHLSGKQENNGVYFGKQDTLINLTNNYGYSEKKEVELGERATKTVTAASIPLEERQAMLRELMQEFEHDGGDEDADL